MRIRSLTRQLPYNVPFNAKVGLIERCFEDWHAHSMSCFDVVHNAARQSFGQLVDKYFGAFTRGGLAEYAK